MLNPKKKSQVFHYYFFGVYIMFKMWHKLEVDGILNPNNFLKNQSI